jgi:hypothetical protein
VGGAFWPVVACGDGTERRGPLSTPWTRSRLAAIGPFQQLHRNFSVTHYLNFRDEARQASCGMCDAETLTSKLRALAYRHRNATLGTVGPLMQDLLQQIDPDYYRSARLLMVRAELEQLGQGGSAFFDVERRSKIPLGMSRSPDSFSAYNERSHPSFSRLAIMSSPPFALFAQLIA